MIDKNWIFQKDRLSEEFFNGLKNFLKLSSFHLNDENKIRCPCVSCMNLYYYDLETIERHIFVRGFYTKYVLWEFHGEDITEIHEDEENAESIVEEDNTLYDSDDEDDDDMIPALEDLANQSHRNIMSNKKSRDLPLSRTRSFGPKKTYNNDSTSTKSPPPVPCSPNEDSTTPSDDEIQELLESKKNTRGPTRGDGVRRSSKNDTSKKIISYRKGELRVYGPNATIFGNTVGVKVRHHAPLQYSGWAKIPPEDKKAVYARIMKKSAAGSKNRAKVSFMHSGGTKSFIQYLHEEKSKQSIGDEVQQQTMKCGEIEMFRKTHYTIENGWINEIAKEKYNKMVELRRDKLIQFEDGLLLVVDEAAIYRQVLGEGKYGWLRGLGPTPGKKISVELSSKHKEIEEERLDKLEKIIEDLRKDQDNNVARIVQENMKIFYESQQGRLLEERSSESPIRIPSMDKQNSFFTQLEPSKEKDQPSSSQKPTKSSSNLEEVRDSPIKFEIPKDTPKGVKAALLAVRFIKASHTFSMVIDPEILDNDEYLHISPIDVIHLGTMKRIGAACIVFYIRILHEKLVKANRAQYFRFFHPILALDSCQAQNAMTMADRMEGTEAGQFWLLSVNTGDHWMLAIIDVLRETCYWLDSIGLPPPNKIKSLMAMTFDYYNASSNRQPKKSGITWKSIKWNGKKTYTKQEIDEIRLEWADQFLEEITEDGVL
ncbi:hypothetical protein G4B88_026265 [Cannabis sativa]|uniref:Transposase-associated domain-containing protein n=3 Tax=Cannabis sativa TaxID=3483 RepID=A0A7J6DJ48_CANSA|nr:hypothetical protein G4B88_026265 [Cannabis sativa]